MELLLNGKATVMQEKKGKTKTVGRGQVGRKQETTLDGGVGTQNLGATKKV